MQKNTKIWGRAQGVLVIVAVAVVSLIGYVLMLSQTGKVTVPVSTDPSPTAVTDHKGADLSAGTLSITQPPQLQHLEGANSPIDIHTKRKESPPVQQTVYSNANTAVAAKIPFTTFANTPLKENDSLRKGKNAHRGPLVADYKPILCSQTMVDKLAAPRLSDTDFAWCKWAISKGGGNVIVGKSWGGLKTRDEQMRFDALNCNAVQNGKNPSCDDSWGDIHIDNWRKSIVPELSCETSRKSKITCHKNDNQDKFCVIEKAQIDFSKYKKYSRSGTTPSKKYENNFISADCGAGKAPEGFPFKHLYTPQVSSQQCDYVHNGTVLMFSHDDIRNLGHTLNDIMNVWVMLWMDGLARDSHLINMLNIDSFKLGHNFDDQPNAFFLPYTKNLNSILKGFDFGTSTLCVQRLLVQPLPPRFFIWESWFTDLPCSFIGPSTLYQRWNMHVRHSYGLISSTQSMKLNQRVQVLLIVRNEKTNLWGTSRTSRNYLNQDAIVAELNTTLDRLSNSNTPGMRSYKLVVQDLSKLDLQHQIALIAESSIMLGMHGAGMASSMHMSIGTKYCCGMVEIYPAGEFTPIKVRMILCKYWHTCMYSYVRHCE